MSITLHRFIPTLLTTNISLSVLVLVNALMFYKLYSRLSSPPDNLQAPNPHHPHGGIDGAVDGGGFTKEPVLIPSPLASKLWTIEEVGLYDGVTKDRILIVIKGNVFDVTVAGSRVTGGKEVATGDVPPVHVEANKFYAPGGSYASLAGQDATIALALFQVPATKQDTQAMVREVDWESLSQEQKERADEWLEMFKHKYPVVGHIGDEGAQGGDDAVKGEPLIIDH